MKLSDLDDEISFCTYTPDDHTGFVECINDFYCGGYPYDRYLTSEYLNRKTGDGSMIVTLAKNKDGRIVGTSAAQKLKGVFDGSILLMLRSVLTEYRGKGVASKQEDYLLDQVKKYYGDSLSLYADVMTHNDISQKTLTRQGFVLCGLRMMLYKSEIMVPKLNYPKGTKMSQAVYCKAINHKDVSLFAPEKHKELIKSIYEKLGVPCSFSEYADIPDDLRRIGMYNISEKPKHSSAEFYIERPAEDFDMVFMPKIKEYLKNGSTCVAYINACFSEGLAVYEKLQKIGFYFTGIKPLSLNGEYIIMSQSDNCSVDHKSTVLYENQFDLINYIFGGNNQ